MKRDKVPISDVQTLKFKRDELFREFECHPGKLALAREIKTIDDEIAELRARKRRGLNLPSDATQVQACANSESRKPNVVS